MGFVNYIEVSGRPAFLVCRMSAACPFPFLLICLPSHDNGGSSRGEGMGGRCTGVQLGRWETEGHGGLTGRESRSPD